jgi:hypothetical protein
MVHAIGAPAQKRRPDFSGRPSSLCPAMSDRALNCPDDFAANGLQFLD